MLATSAPSQGSGASAPSVDPSGSSSVGGASPRSSAVPWDPVGSFEPLIEEHAYWRPSDRLAQARVLCGMEEEGQWSCAVAGAGVRVGGETPWRPWATLTLVGVCMVAGIAAACIGTRQWSAVHHASLGKAPVGVKEEVVDDGTGFLLHAAGYLINDKLGPFDDRDEAEAVVSPGDRTEAGALVAAARRSTTTTTTTTSRTSTSRTSTTVSTTSTVATTHTTRTMTSTSTTTLPGKTCGIMEENTDYVGNDITSVHNMSKPEFCCSHCLHHPRCLAWTWSKHLWVCYLKGAVPRPLTKLQDRRYTSGKPLESKEKGHLVVKVPTPGASVFCIQLILPWSYEPGLVALQYKTRSGIFGCDEYTVYSNKAMSVAPGVTTAVVNNSLRCKKGGIYMTALNTDIFVALWEKVIMDNRFGFHDWTAKVDPDAVFFAPRLRAILRRHKEGPNGVLLNNCKYGLHGPLEVFSRNALRAWAEGKDRCKAHFDRKCSGPCPFGEDMYMDKCLALVLGVRRDNDWGLLWEDHCDPPRGWSKCLNDKIVAFHPFKNKDKYQHCLANANSGTLVYRK